MQSQIQNEEATPIPTATVLPTATSDVDVTGQQYYLPTPNYTTQTCYAASLASQSISSGKDMDQGEDFTQTWKVVNAGTCTWPDDTELVFVDGNRMNGDSSRRSIRT
jgi:hypothetical protein